MNNTYTVRRTCSAAQVGATLRRKARKRARREKIRDIIFRIFMYFVIVLIAAATITMIAIFFFTEWDKPAETPNYYLEERLQNAPFSFSSYEEYENYMYGNGR